MSNITFTGQQKEAIALATDSVNNKELVTIGGFAGTGKTTVLKQVFDNCPGGAIAAFAGKACDVLRRKGMPGQTIHSLIYKFDAITEEFVKVDSLEGIAWIGIDEGSMVGGSIWSDLCSYNLPTLVIGDPGQLKPVDDNVLDLLDKPDYTLTEIHRQALDNPIIRLSMEIRGGDDIDWRPFARPRNSIFSPEELLWPDMIVCGYNNTRVSLNTEVRKLLGYNKHVLHEHEKFICKSNDSKLGVFNGQGFVVNRIHSSGNSKGEGKYDLISDCGRLYPNVSITNEGFNRLYKLPWSKVRNHLGKRIIGDYGYCCTGHGSQGSEWDKVAYIDEPSDLWDVVSHRYTGCTRAAYELRVYKDVYDY